MKIKIEEKNNDKIEDALAAVNEKAWSHTMNYYREVAEAAGRFEKALEGRGLAKTKQRGVVCKFKPDGKHLPNAYKNKAITTMITVERGATGWFLTSVERDYIYPGSSEVFEMKISREQADIISAHAFRKIAICETA